VINDHPLVAAEIGADGVHVGQDDASLADVRAVFPGFVGKSTHSPAQARVAVAEGADYIGFGPMFATATKPDYVPIGTDDIRAVHAEVGVPIFCIGGVNSSTLPRVLAAGARRVVVVSAILLAGDVAATCRELRRMLAGE
jgi:thiamine-phosphate pyrophosphorylase